MFWDANIILVIYCFQTNNCYLIESIFLLLGKQPNDPNILIGIIDNGFDFFHPDLTDRLIPSFYASGWYHTEFYENVAHSTIIASIIVAKENKIGMVGLASYCRLLTTSHGKIEHKIIKLKNSFFIVHPDANKESFRGAPIKH